MADFNIEQREREGYGRDILEMNMHQVMERACMYDNAAQNVDRKYYSFFRDRAFSLRQTAQSAYYSLQRVDESNE